MVRSERITRLREQYMCRPAVCFERALHLTESYKETTEMTPLYRRAKAFENIINKKTITIGRDELIVGNSTEKVKGGHILPEIRCEWFEEQLPHIHERALDRFDQVTQEEMRLLKEEILPYWNSRSLVKIWNDTVPAELQELHHLGCIGVAHCDNSMYNGHYAFDHERLVKLGIRGILEQIREERGNCNFSTKEGYEKAQMLDAMTMELNSVIVLANRYADLAEQQLAQESDPARAEELKLIAATCRKVPENPPETFYEALQAVWMMHVALSNEGPCYCISFNRFDQYMYPFYKRDKEAGILTDEKALELCTMLLLKTNDYVILEDQDIARSAAGLPMVHTVIIGGIDAQGNDAVNDLSYILLDAEEQAALPLNDVCVRISSKNPDSFVLKGLEVARNLQGKLKFFSDDTNVPLVQSDNRTLEQARNYTVCGCWELTGADSWDLVSGMFSVPWCMELALNNGVSRMTGKQMGPKTGDPRSFKSVDEIWEAYRLQCAHALKLTTAIADTDKYLYNRYCPLPLQSAMYEPCVRQGVNALQLNNNSIRCLGFAGAADVGDSVTALAKLVFEQKKYTMSDFVDAMDCNFEGKEAMLRDIAAITMYGNDDDFADAMMDKGVEIAGQELAKLTDYEGRPYRASCAIATASVFLGSNVGALPDGRLAGLPVAEGGLSPYQGRNTVGPMATFRSVAKVDVLKDRITNGAVLNMRISNDAVKGEAELKKLAAMVRTYLETGGVHVQFNFTSDKVLRDAQKHPEKYRDLLVRVATYSAFFVEIGEELQEDVIQRYQFDSL